MPLQIYLSVSNDKADRACLTDLQTHLAPLARQRGARVCSVNDLPVGGDLRSERLRLLAGADLILLLLSPDYVAHCDAEAREAVLQQKRGAVVIPLRLRPCSYRDEPYGALGALPAEGDPLSLRSPAQREQELVDLCAALGEPLRRLATRSAPPSRASLPPPAGAYHPDYYVRRPRQERKALRQLEAQGALVLHGPRDFGKATLLGHLLAEFTRQHPQARAVRLDLGVLQQQHPEALASEAALLRCLASLLVQALRPGEDAAAVVQRAFAGLGTDALLVLLLLEDLLREADPLVLCLEQLDRLHGRPYENAFFAMLRGFVLRDRAPWDRLRLVVTTATEPALLQSPETSAFIIAATIIDLPPLELAQAEALAAQYGFAAPVAGLERAFARVGGHPLLLRLWLHEAASEGVTPAEVGEWSVVRGHLLSLRRQIEVEKLGPLLQRQQAGGELTLEEHGALQRLGLITAQSATRYTFRSPLYEDFAGDLCQPRG